MTQPAPFSLGDAIQGVLAANPNIGQTPELAAGLAQSPDPYGTTEVASHASNLDAVQQSHDAHAARSSSGGFWGTLSHVAHDVGSALHGPAELAGWGLRQLSAPLHEVQHNYRYIRAVFDRHGATAGTLELLGASAGGVLGGVFGGPQGAVLGSEAALGAERKIFYHQTDADTRTAYTDKRGDNVSFGRDLANMANEVTGGHVQNTPGKFDAFDLISGAGDAAFDIGGDPLMQVGSAKRAADLQGNTKIARLLGGEATALGRRIGTGRLIGPADSAEDVLKVAQNRPEVAKAFDTLASPDMTAGQIATRFPKLAPLAQELGAADSRDAVAAVFHQAATVGEYGFSTAGLPKTGVTRGVLARLNAGIYDRATIDLKNADGTARVTEDGTETLKGLNRAGKAYNLLQSYRPYAYDPGLRKLDTKSFDPTNQQAYNAIARVMRFSQSPQTVGKVMDRYFAEGSDIATHAAVYKNSVIDMLRAGGVADTHPILEAMRGKMDGIGVGGENDLYALGLNGENLSRLERADGSSVNAAIWPNQQGRLSFPNFQAIHNVLRDQSGGAIKALGSADQVVSSQYMSRVFKPLALVNLGFALRVSMAELLPGALALGGRKVLGTTLLNNGRKLAPEAYASQVEAHTAALAGDSADELTRVAGAHAGLDPAVHPIAPEEIDRAVKDTPGASLQRPNGVDPSEADHVGAAAAKVLYDSLWGKPLLVAGKGQIGKGLMRMSHALLDQDYRDVLLNLTVRHGSHIVDPALMTGEHGLVQGTDAAEKTMLSINHTGASVAPKFQVGDGFQMYKTSDAKHPAMWSSALGEPASSEGGRLMARTVLAHSDPSAGRLAAEDAHDAYVAGLAGRTDAEAVREHGLMRVKEGDPTLSQTRYDAMMGVVTGEDGTVNRNLLEHIAAGTKPDVAELQKIPLEQRPAMVKGPVLNPAREPATFDKLVAKGFKPLEAIINHISREPLYVAQVTKEYKFLKPLIDQGTLSVDDAMRMAEQRAVPNMLPLIHNIELRNQFADTFRNVIPFYFAQEQAARRYGTVALTDPQAAAKLLLVHHAMSDTGIVRTNPDDPSDQYVVMPFGGPAAEWLGKGIAATGLIGIQAGIPTQISGNLQSLKTVIPEGNLPSLSPVVSVPLKMIEDRFPESRPLISPVVGQIAENTSVWDQVIPSGWIHALKQAAQASPQSSQFTTAYIYAAANAVRTGKLREDMSPPERDLELAKIRNTARIYFVAKAFFAATSPLSPKMDVGDFKLRDELTATIKSNGGDFATGMDAFLKAHPDATPSTVFLSESRTGAALPRSTGATTQFLADHGPLVTHYSYGAPFLIPQSKGNYDATAQNMELALGLRQRKDIKRFTETVFIAQGANEYFDKEHQYQAALKGLQDSGDTQQAGALTAGWQSWASSFKQAHPSFATDLGSQTGTRTVDGVQALAEFGEIFAKGLAPASPQTTLVKTLYDQYGQYAQAYKQYKAAGDRTSTAALYKGWQAHLDQFIVDNPDAKQVVRTVFARLPRPVPDSEAS